MPVDRDSPSRAIIRAAIGEIDRAALAKAMEGASEKVLAEAAREAPLPEIKLEIYKLHAARDPGVWLSVAITAHHDFDDSAAAIEAITKAYSAGVACSHVAHTAGMLGYHEMSAKYWIEDAEKLVAAGQTEPPSLHYTRDTLDTVESSPAGYSYCNAGEQFAEAELLMDAVDAFELAEANGAAAWRVAKGFEKTGVPELTAAAYDRAGEIEARWYLWAASLWDSADDPQRRDESILSAERGGIDVQTLAESSQKLGMWPQAYDYWERTEANPNALGEELSPSVRWTKMALCAHMAGLTSKRNYAIVQAQRHHADPVGVILDHFNLRSAASTWHDIVLRPREQIEANGVTPEQLEYVASAVRAGAVADTSRPQRMRTANELRILATEPAVVEPTLSM